LYFKGLIVPKPEERRSIIEEMHQKIGHFGEEWTLIEIYY
jgi:hypothetical protein